MVEFDELDEDDVRNQIVTISNELRAVRDRSTLVLEGATEHLNTQPTAFDNYSEVVAYRLANFWLPIPVGAVAYVVLELSLIHI